MMATWKKKKIGGGGCVCVCVCEQVTHLKMV